MPVELSTNARKLRDLGRALRQEENGAALKRDLTREIRAALKPAQAEARASIASMPSRGHAGMKLRSGVARRVGTQVRMTARVAGASVRARGTPNIRGFASAPRQLNSVKGWRHPLPGNKRVWVRQRGKPGWFDVPMWKRVIAYKRSVNRVLDSAADRIKRKV